jgi:hypothetical protein
VLYIERRGGGQGDLGRAGRREEFPLGPHRNKLASAHGESPREQSGYPAEQHHLAAHTRGSHAHDQGKVADQPVVCPEDCCPEGAGQPVSSPCGQSPHHFFVDLFIRCHGRSGGGILGVRRTALSTLGEGKDKH